MRERPLGLPLSALALFAAMTLATTIRMSTPPFVDFKLLYCGGNALRLGLDPYRIGSLHACEAARHFFPPAVQADVTGPAPLPTTTLGFFALLSALPYDLALAIFLALGIVATVYVARGLRELTGLGTIPVVLALSLGTAWLLVFLSQPIVFMMLALVRSAIELERGRPRRAALLASATVLQPHVGLAVLLALFVSEPRARATIAGIAFACAAVLACTPHLTLEYVRDVIPLAAVVHASNFANLGTAWILHALGMIPETAARLGGAISLVSTIAGAFLCRLCARRFASPGLAVALAPAFALAFDVYTHVQQASLVLPVALMLFARRPGALAFGAVACLAVPWLMTASIWQCAAAMLVVTLGLARTLAIGKRGEVLTYVATVAMIGLGFVGAGYHPPPPDSLARAGATDPALYAEANVDAGDRLERIDRPLVLALFKLPTWFGYATVLGLALGGARRATVAESEHGIVTRAPA